MPSELETQVAEAKLSCGYVHPGQDIYHPDGHLRWPLLSRTCPCLESWNSCEHCNTMGAHWKAELCEYCHGSGRIPDVTLEVVVNINIIEGRTQPQDWFLFDNLHLRTPKDAACAALLASILPVSIP